MNPDGQAYDPENPNVKEVAHYMYKALGAKLAHDMEKADRAKAALLDGSVEEIADILGETKVKLQACQGELTRLLNEEAFIEAAMRAAASREFYRTYGEWDWEVRRHYIELVKSSAYTPPVADNAIGYVFELWNYEPFLPTDSKAGELHPTIMWKGRFGRITCTEFVKAEQMGRCKVTPKILQAFQNLKYYPDSEGRGFAMSRAPKSWKEQDDFDYEGYKFHLVGEV